MKIETALPTIVFVTVCTKDRKPRLANDPCHALLREVWLGARSWLVGRYVVMPDHVHFFCTPGDRELPLGNWVRYWKSQFTKLHEVADHRWQSDFWDRRLRSDESYDEKWWYTLNNPVRHGLVSRAEDWLYQGELNELRWH